jgi:hypothetical protein
MGSFEVVRRGVFPLYRHLFALNSPDSARLTPKPRPKD